MKDILIRTRNGVYEAELDDSDLSNEIWLALPFSNYINMLGDEIFFEFPISSEISEKNRVTILDKGDIAYWPKAGAFCIFFGPTPLSKEDKKPVSRYPVIKIGKLKGEFDSLEYAGDRQKIIIEPVYMNDHNW